MKKYLFKPDRTQTTVEEVINASIHGLGAILSLGALITLTILAAISGGVEKTVACAIFGIALVSMYTSSTLYHSARDTRIKKRYKIFDHVSIYLLIAGTYTPIALVDFPSNWGIAVISSMWGLAIAGVIFKLFFTGRFEKTSTLIYVLMGWSVVIAAKPLINSVPYDGVMWLVAGGLSYTLGVVFYIWKRLRFSHAIWHLFVLGGSICHFLAILFYVVPVHH